MLGRIGRYELVDEIGAGGMAAVFRAHDTSTGRTVALKQLRCSEVGARRAKLEALFEREYHTLVRLKHPRIIEVHDYGVCEDGPYYTMELLDGSDLQALAPLSFRDVCRYLRDVASSLALLHAQRLLHRDITPRNVRLTSDGRAKLIDFGALSSFGVVTSVVGTPPCIPPEVLRGLPLDQRTDLFALGALAYWALTGRHAFPARQINQLWGHWKKPPAPPSQLAPDVPPALDDLVLSLLNTDSLARPSSAAQVIDELTAIAGLEAEEHEESAASYLSSGALVGRDEELGWLEERLTRAINGHGTEVVIEGPSGTGKTRLLQEVGVKAQLRGALVLRADAQATSQPFGVVASLAVQLLDALPELARDAAGSSASLIAHLSTELAARLQSEASDPLQEDPGERRARFQTALHDWFIAVALATEQTLVVAVDNVQAADDNSAAFLAALSHEAYRFRLAIVVAQRTGEQVVAPIPLRVLRKRSAILKLAGLGQAACEELVGVLFGHANNTGRLGKVLFDRSGGNPQLCMDLAQLVVKRGIAKYVGGSWVLPLDIAEEELPSRIEEVLAEKLEGLRPATRQLCEALSVYAGPVPIERCLGLVEGLAEGDVYRALDELEAAQILSAEDGNYGFNQRAIRESILGHVGDARRKELSRRAAKALLERGEADVQARVEAAWHLLNAGEEEHGADLMTEAAQEFLQDQGVEDIDEVVRAIETAMALYDKQGRSRYEVARLLFPLMSLAFFVDWRVTLKHGERAIDLGLDITGLGLAGRLSRFLPNPVALGIGLLVAFVRFSWQRLRGLKYNLIEAIEGFCGLIPAAIGTQNIIFDLPAVERFTEKLRPLTLFGESHIAAVMYDFALTQYYMSSGREDEAREILERLRRVFPDPSIKEVLGEAHWKAMYGGILFSLGIVYPYEFGTLALEMAEEMDTLGVRVWSMAADEVRMLHHASRGESEQVQRYRDRVELFAVQGSTTWQAEIFWPILLMDSEIRSGHTLGVRTIREQLMRRAKDHPSLLVYARVARATHVMLRGEPEAAIALYEPILQELEEDDDAGGGWQAFRACFGYATALNALGEHARAKQYTSELLSRAGTQTERVVGHYLEPQRQLALAESGLGNHARAVEILDGLLAKHGGEDQPLLIGLLHKARAEVAMSMGDAPTFELHFAEMERCFRCSRNPSLISQAERLAAEAVRAGLREGVAAQVVRGALGLGEATKRAIAQLPHAEDPFAAALQIVMQEANAQRGFLFVLASDRLELVATSAGGEPPVGAQEELLSNLLRLRELSLEDETDTVAVSSSPLTVGTALSKSVFVDSLQQHSGSRSMTQEHHDCFVLCAGGGDGSAEVVGGLIMVGVERARACNIELLEPIAAALRDLETDGALGEVQPQGMQRAQ